MPLSKPVRRSYALRAMAPGGGDGGERAGHEDVGDHGAGADLPVDDEERTGGAGLLG